MILTYHHIGNGADENWVSIKSFKQQIDELLHYEVVHIDEYNENNPNQVVITFDDGAADIKNALPILKKYGYPFELFIVGDWFGHNEYIGVKDVQNITAVGGRLQWHTKTHRKLTELSVTEIYKEIDVPDEISSLDAKGFTALAFPFWLYDENVLHIASSRFPKLRSGNGFAKFGDGILDSIKVKENFTMSNNIVKFIEMVVPIWPCNLRCHYCYVGQHNDSNNRSHSEAFQYSPQQVATALCKKRLGGVAIINFCANGETLILPKNVEYIKKILEEGHFVMIVSNMTITKAIDELLKLPPEMRLRLFFKCSFHYLELKRLNLMSTFANNVNKVWQAGCSATVEVTPSDELEPYIDDLSKFSLEHFGALPHITVARDELRTEMDRLTKHSSAEYEKIWSVFDSELFRFKSSIWGKKIHQFCYAGDWAYSINLATGNIFRCSSRCKVGNLFVEKKLPANPACKKCSFPHCFNAHAWIGFGCVPDIKAPTHAQMRDRVRADGTHWLTPLWTNVFSQKLYENNKQYPRWKQWLKNKLCRTKNRKSRSFWRRLRERRQKIHHTS
jgi:hypothetical protein